MPTRGGFDAGVGRPRDYGAEGSRVRGVTEAPDVFDLARGEFKGFGNVDVGGEGFDANWGDGFGI